MRFRRFRRRGGFRRRKFAIRARGFGIRSRFSNFRRRNRSFGLGLASKIRSIWRRFDGECKKTDLSATETITFAPVASGQPSTIVKQLIIDFMNLQPGTGVSNLTGVSIKLKSWFNMFRMSLTLGGETAVSNVVPITYRVIAWEDLRTVPFESLGEVVLPIDDEPDSLIDTLKIPIQGTEVMYRLAQSGRFRVIFDKRYTLYRDRPIRVHRYRVGAGKKIRFALPSGNFPGGNIMAGRLGFSFIFMYINPGGAVSFNPTIAFQHQSRISYYDN